MNWTHLISEAEVYTFTKGLIALRKELKYFITQEKYKVTWHGIHYNQPDWSNYSRSIAWHIQGEESLYVVANLYHENLRFELPPGEAHWVRIIDSHLPIGEDLKLEGVPLSENDYEVVGYSICIFKDVPIVVEEPVKIETKIEESVQSEK